jgi:hypothetical protein
MVGFDLAWAIGGILIGTAAILMVAYVWFYA